MHENKQGITNLSFSRHALLNLFIDQDDLKHVKEKKQEVSLNIFKELFKQFKQASAVFEVKSTVRDTCVASSKLNA